MLSSFIGSRICLPFSGIATSLVSNPISSLSTDAAPKPFSSIPGPKPAPIIGNLKDLRKLFKGNAFEESYFHQLTKQYGDIYMLKSPERPVLVISNADLINEVFKNEGKIPVRSTHSELNIFKYIHDKNDMPIGLFAAHKNDWKRLRSVMTKQVTPRRLEHFGPAISSVANDLCDQIVKESDQNGYMKDIWFPLQMWAMKGGTRVIFNEDIDSVMGTANAASFVKAVHSFLDALNGIGFALPIYKVYPTKPYKKYVSGFNEIRRIAKEILNNHYENLRTEIEAGTVDEDTAVGLLDQWLIEGKLSEDEALVQACDMLFAGVDTTSNTATFMLHEIAKNPQVQHKVYNEVMEVLGPNDNPTPEQLQKLSLVRKCAKETLRMYPLVPVYPREVERDCVLMGYHIPAGTSCLFNWQSLSMDSRYFKDPLRFDPDRWSRDTDDIHPYASLPFGFGPRSCYGRRIAELELHLLLTRILQRFQLSTDQEKLKIAASVTLRPDEAVRIKFTNR